MNGAKNQLASVYNLSHGPLLPQHDGLSLILLDLNLILLGLEVSPKADKLWVQPLHLGRNLQRPFQVYPKELQMWSICRNTCMRTFRAWLQVFCESCLETLRILVTEMKLLQPNPLGKVIQGPQILFSCNGLETCYLTNVILLGQNGLLKLPCPHSNAAVLPVKDNFAFLTKVVLSCELFHNTHNLALQRACILFERLALRHPLPGNCKQFPSETFLLVVLLNDLRNC